VSSPPRADQAEAAPAAERSADGRWIIVNGRRWRASDPAIPDVLRRELVDELMAARRAVAAAGRTKDPGAEAAARQRVHQAKVALGERGEPWWDAPSPAGRDARLRAAVVTLAGHRGPQKTICPSDAARAVGGSTWRSLMDPARDVIRRLALEGVVEVTARGELLDPSGQWRGPVRARIIADHQRPPDEG